jgi:hypothetical protein
MKNDKSLALGKKKMGSNHERRSSKEPETAPDKKLSQEHLRDSVDFNKRHAREHETVLNQDERLFRKARTKALKNKAKEGIEYNKDHIKKHTEAAKDDEQLLKKRKEA